eukprot:TRINITY_DN4546_c0_g1_i1.p1 TRINITY_DN4546_c0_g1~~TRINITY_DN4546_c0_g1_i1.p1  ORF type:complete len:325 (-),score=12.46 TRINITY_DN4546_c0_g1_i1:220-1194(-)
MQHSTTNFRHVSFLKVVQKRKQLALCVRNSASVPKTTQISQKASGEQYTLREKPAPLTVPQGALPDVLSASLPLLSRLGAGAFTLGYSSSIVADKGQYSILKVGGQAIKESSKAAQCKRPELPLNVYEFETCPYCKKVREAISILDLDVMVYPCPKNGERFRSVVLEKGQKTQFPFLEDPNTNMQMFESDDIIKYLFQEYGDGQVPFVFNLPASLATAGAQIGLTSRREKGRNVQPSIAPEKPLVMYGYEASPFVKIVREQLCELEIPYLYRNCARGSLKRQELFEKWGSFAVPYIEDPNTLIAMFESTEIIKYLQETYGTSQS